MYQTVPGLPRPRTLVHGQVGGGLFVTGANPVSATFERTVQPWLAAPAA